MDTIVAALDRVRLDFDGVAWCMKSMGIEVIVKKKTKGVILIFSIGNIPLLKVISTSCADEYHRVTKITCEVPKLIFGHNGRLITAERQWHLALTRIVELLKLVTMAEDHGRLLPGIGEDNLGYWCRVDVPIHQVDDGTLLRKSHGFRLPRRKRKPLVVAGESTTLRGSPVEIKFYDKGLEARTPFDRADSNSICLRIEASFKKPGRFANALEQTIAHDTFATSFSLADAVLVHQRALQLLAGQSIDHQSRKGKDKAAAFIVWSAMNGEISVDRSVEFWVSLLGTKGAKTAQRLSKAVSDLLAGSVRNQLLHEVTLEDLQNAPVIENRVLELRFAKLAREWSLPSEPALDIVAAYSQKAVRWGRPSRESLLDDNRQDLHRILNHSTITP